MNNKRTGNNYERQVAKQLSLWLTDGQSDDVCWRDIGSGNRATIRAKQGKTSTRSGDFVPTDLNYKWFFDAFFVDSKCYKEWNPVFINESNIKSNSIFNQWVKVIEESQGRIPFMICHIRDRRTPDFILLPSYVRYPDGFDLSFMYYTFGEKSLGFHKDCCLLLVDEFFKTNVKEFYELNKEHVKC